ncbi:hypothetical protein LINPERPRIM_LOCUS38911 [Linum perenne]
MDYVPQQSDDCVEIGEPGVWPAVVENFLLDMMLEEMKKGHLVSSTFSKSGWQRIKKCTEGQVQQDIHRESGEEQIWCDEDQILKFQKTIVAHGNGLQ